MTSKISGPIHAFGGGASAGGGDSYGVGKPAPRVRPGAAQQIATRNQGGSIGSMLGIQGKAVSPGTWKKDPLPKDHFSENYRRMRRIQRASKQKENEATGPVPVKALWKSEKFAQVPSKVKDMLEAAPPPPRPSSANYLRAHSRAGAVDPDLPRPRSQNACLSFQPKKTAVPRAPSRQERPPSRGAEMELLRKDFNFIKINGSAAKYSKIKRAPSLTALDDLKKKKEDDLTEYHRKQKGKVPDYLVRRQTDWSRQEAERVANMPDPNMPPGHRTLPKEERLKTLELLRGSQTEYLKQLQSLPIRTDTLRVKTRREELERKLAEIEEALKIFSRKTVYVKIDE